MPPITLLLMPRQCLHLQILPYLKSHFKLLEIYYLRYLHDESNHDAYMEIFNVKDIVDIKSDGRNIPDAWVSNGTENIPVEMKKGTFNKKALSQLQRYLSKYKCNKGIAIGRDLSVEIPDNIQFIDISEVKKFDS